jgi:[citrate (pro-3S)-lyase] ligase
LRQAEFLQTARILAQTAVTNKNGGSAFDFLHDNGITKVSFYGNSKEMLSAFAMLAAEETLAAGDFISDEGIYFFNAATTQRSKKLDAVTGHDPAVPILILDDAVGNETLDRLRSLTEYIYSAFRILKYSALKNAVFEPIRSVCPDAAIVYMRRCYLNEVQNRSDYERLLLRHKSDDAERIAQMRLRLVYGGNEEYFNSCFKNAQWPSFINDDGVLKAKDTAGKYVTHTNGFRYVADLPAGAERNIFFIGNSVSYGYRVSDKDTIESRLQRILNKRFPKYAVYNVICKEGHSIASLTNIIRGLPLKSGDIVVLITESCECLNWDNYITPYTKTIIRINAASFFDRPHNMGEVFIDQSHMNGKGNQKYANILFEAFKKKNLLGDRKESSKAPEKVTTLSDNSELNEYIESLKPYLKSGISGAVVMNCSPFTLGHRHLIEYAANRVDNLYIFVVEKDNSIFPFADRIDLARKGVSDLSNVYVLPSGMFILSADWIEMHFKEGDIRGDVIDASFDIGVFASYVAPSLNISARFAGEEPLDRAAERYNKDMSVLLPMRGVRFEVIPRTESDGEVISASTVRELLMKQDFEQIARLAPESTLEYLRGLNTKLGAEKPEPAADIEMKVEVKKVNFITALWRRVFKRKG